MARLRSLKLDRIMARPTILRRDTLSLTIKVTIKGAIMAVVTIPVPGAAVVQASVDRGTADVVTACPGIVVAVAAVQVSADRGTADVATVCPGIVDAVAMVRASVARGIVDVATACPGRTITVEGC